MILGFIKGLLSSLGAWAVGLAQSSQVKLLQLRVALLLRRLVYQASVQLLVVGVVVVLPLLAGFVLLHVGALYLVYQVVTPTAFACILIGMGLLYMLWACAFLLWYVQRLGPYLRLLNVQKWLASLGHE